MCGLAGHWKSGASFAELEATARRMACTLQHRGPDDSGWWTDEALGLAFGFQRLSILDLSATGHQPMVSSSGRFVVAFNGEIYNHIPLRSELEGAGYRFQGHSDTEVLLAAVETWGIQESVQRFAGMFAFALVDRESRQLHLVRDRLGEKPLYYGLCDDFLLFGSELKSLKEHPAWSGQIDRSALALYLRHNYVPAPYSIFLGIRKVRPGTIVTYELDENRHEPVETVFWSARERILAAHGDPLMLDAEGQVTELEGLLGDVVEREMISDVPLGAFLSGGIDSSLIVSLMQERSRARVRTFTIGFHESEFNEANYAARVAGHLGTDHTELYVTPAEARDVIPLLPDLYDEPFADSSQIPTFLVSQMASMHVNVCLSGDGGDEVFGGYEWYYSRQRAWDSIQKWPLRARRSLAGILASVPQQSWDRLLAALPVSHGGRRLTGYRVHRAADVTRAATPKELYHSLTSFWPDPVAVVKNSHEPPTLLSDDDPWPPELDVFEGMMLADLVTYLPDDILVKVDRAAMGVSLETRAPFLDHSVVEYAWRIPLAQKASQGEGKQILRRVLDRYVPRSMVDRPKTGFSVPIGKWLRGPLRPWAEEYLDKQRLESEGFFHVEPIRTRWREHLDGIHNWEHQLWGILMFEIWLERQ